MASATVTPLPASFRLSSRPPHSTAARSHTLSTPVVYFTKSEPVKLPGTAASSAAL